MVIVDTSVWVQAFRVPGSVEKREVEALIRAGEVAMVGVIFAELMRGARDRDGFRDLEEDLDAIPFLEADKQSWRRAGVLLFNLRRQGLTVPLTDAVIAAIAIGGGHEVYTLDEHFQRVPELTLHAATAK